MTSRARDEYRYEKLTWPEINDAVELGKVCIVPCGAVEQHGPHLPLDVDIVCPTGIALGAGRQAPETMLVLPTVCYGYTGHVMDFPGTINTDFEHFMHQVLDITKSLAYHGFKKIVLLNGHGSNMPNLDLVARRTNLETDAECVLTAWWNLLTVDKDFLPGWRESKFPGGCAHACELETSLYLHLAPERVQMAKALDDDTVQRKYIYVDLAGSGPVKFMDWWGRWSETGIIGEATKGTAEKGRTLFESFVENMVGFVDEFAAWPIAERKDQHTHPVQRSIRW